MIVKAIGAQLLNEIVDFIEPVIQSANAVFQRADPFQKMFVQNRQGTVHAVGVSQNHQLCSALDTDFFANLVFCPAFLAENHRHLGPPMECIDKILRRFSVPNVLPQPSFAKADTDDTWDR